MADLTEREILACIKENFRLAAEHCDALAVLPARGPTYNAMRRELKLIEGAARQMAYWREDARWLRIGLMMEEAHQRAGHWLRRHYPRPLFARLADNLRAGLLVAERYELAATGRSGMILPTVLPGPARESRPVQVLTCDVPAVHKLILPAGHA